MRPFILFLALATLPLAAEEPAALAVPAASEQVHVKFTAIMKQQVTEMLKLLAASNPQLTADDVAQGTESLMKQVELTYGALFTLPEPEAAHLLAAGPDDKANMDAMKRDIDLWKQVKQPMPALYKKMQDDVSVGVIKDGLTLDLTRRISEFHLHQLGLLP